MKKRILVRGPLLSRSGYGEQARFALRALRAHEKHFDIYAMPTGWGKTGWIWEDSEERKWIDSLIKKTIQHQQALQQSNTKPQYDVSLQITIPSEWEKNAAYNVGYTAGIEATKISPEWVEKSHLMDHIIVVSNFSKEIFEKTVYNAVDQSTRQKTDNFRCTTPITVVNYPVRKFEGDAFELDLDYDFNFFCAAQWGPRKNLDNTIKWFVEEFIEISVKSKLV